MCQVYSAAEQEQDRGSYLVTAFFFLHGSSASTIAFQSS